MISGSDFMWRYEIDPKYIDLQVLEVKIAGDLFSLQIMLFWYGFSEKLGILRIFLERMLNKP